MSSMAALKQQLESLRNIRAKGVHTYSIKDRSMTYRSDRELANAIADLEAQIRTAESGVVRKVKIRSTKGLS